MTQDTEHTLCYLCLRHRQSFPWSRQIERRNLWNAFTSWSSKPPLSSSSPRVMFWSKTFPNKQVTWSCLTRIINNTRHIPLSIVGHDFLHFITSKESVSNQRFSHQDDVYSKRKCRVGAGCTQNQMHKNNIQYFHFSRENGNIQTDASKKMDSCFLSYVLPFPVCI
jgi:hypothetical protein